MPDLLQSPQIQLRWRMFRYYLSIPKFDPTSTPMTLKIRPLPFWLKIRALAVVLSAAVIISSAYTIKVHGWVYYEPGLLDDLSGLAVAGLFWAVITFGGKRLSATFGPADVQVQEAGVGEWNEPLKAYRGLAWMYYKGETDTDNFSSGTRFVTPMNHREVVLYHWIELQNPNPARSLVLSVGREEAGIRERLEQYSHALNQPIVATRVEAEGSRVDASDDTDADMPR